MSDTNLIVMGRFGAPHGVKGWIKIISHSQPQEQILEYSPWKIKIDGRWQDFAFKESQLWSNKLVVLPDFATNRNDVEHLVNVDIAVPRESLPELDEGFYWSDLVGLKVLDTEGRELGEVASMLATGANDVLVCKREGEREHMIPFVRPQIVKDVDLEARTVTVDWEPL